MVTKKLFLVDDHKIMRDAVRAFLIGKPQFKVIGEAASIRQFNDTVFSSVPDLFLLDLVLPDGSGLDLIQVVKHKFPHAGILILTAEMNEETICQAVQSGADGFMNKDTSSEELVKAMEVVLSGEPWFSQNLSQLVYRSFRKKVIEVQEASLLATISDREMEVIRLLGDGLSFREIAEKLFISPRTVETHKNNLLDKLGLKNSVGLLKYGIKHKLIEL